MYGPGPQPPGPQPPQWGVPPAPQWGGPPPQQWQPPAPPKKRRVGLIVGICLGVVVLLGGGGFAIFAIATDDSVEVHRPAGGPDVVARAYVDAVAKRDPIGLQNVNCHPSTEFPATEAVDGFAKDEVQIQLGQKLDTPYNWAYYEVQVSRAGHGPATVRLGLTHDDAGSWCVFVTGRGLPVSLSP